MIKNIEVEARGPLTKNDYIKLNKKLSKFGKFISCKDRVLIDYSTLLKNQGVKKRTKDIRLRVTNKIPEIIVKLGRWGGNDQREELSVFTEKGSFDNLVKIFNTLGYGKGILCVRNITAYKYKNIEFALVKAGGDRYFYEAEIIVNKNIKNKTLATVKIRQICEELGLDIFLDNEYYEYINILNKEVNEFFNFKNYTDNYFKNRFKL